MSQRDAIGWVDRLARFHCYLCEEFGRCTHLRLPGDVEVREGHDFGAASERCADCGEFAPDVAENLAFERRREDAVNDPNTTVDELIQLIDEAVKADR